MRLDVTGGSYKTNKGMASSIKLEIQPVNEELQKAIKAIAMYDSKSRLKVEESVRKAVSKMRLQAQKRVPVQSGGLEKSIFSRFNRETCTGYFGAKAPHAHLIELGVKVSTSKPQKKKTLRMVGNNDTLIYPASAKIPRRYPRPFIRPAYEQERANFIAALKKAVKPKP